MSSLNLSSTPAASPATQRIVVWTDEATPKPLERGELVYIEDLAQPNIRPPRGQLQATAKVYRRGNGMTYAYPCATVAEAVTWCPQGTVSIASVALVIQGTDTLRLIKKEPGDNPAGTRVYVDSDNNIGFGGAAADNHTTLGFTSTAATKGDRVVQVYFTGCRT